MKTKEPMICPLCHYGRYKGVPAHSPTCRRGKWEALEKREEENTRLGKSNKSKKSKGWIEDYHRKKRLGPPASVNSAAKAKSHPQSSWPPMISGGAVESNRRRH